MGNRDAFKICHQCGIRQRIMYRKNMNWYCMYCINGIEKFNLNVWITENKATLIYLLAIVTLIICFIVIFFLSSIPKEETTQILNTLIRIFS